MKTLLLALLISGSVFAQGQDKGNGGSGDESALAANQAEMEQVGSKIKLFFTKNKKELQTMFPEFDINELLTVYKQTDIEIVEETLRDQHGIERTCVNYADQKLIQCRSSMIDKLKSNPSALFVLDFHEHLGIMGVEVTSPEHLRTTDGYAISKRISSFVTKTQNYDLVLNRPIAIDPRATFTRTFDGACAQISESGSFIGEVDQSHCSNLFVYWTVGNFCMEVVKGFYRPVIGAIGEISTKGLPIIAIGKVGYYERRKVENHHCSPKNAYFIKSFDDLRSQDSQPKRENLVKEHISGRAAFECSAWGGFKFPAAKRCARKMARNYCESKGKEAFIFSSRADGFQPSRGWAYAKAVVVFECD